MFLHQTLMCANCLTFIWLYSIIATAPACWDSSVSLVIRLWAGLSGVWFLKGTGDNLFLHHVQTGCGLHSAFFFQSVLECFTQVKWLGCRAYHLPPSGAEDKNELSCISSVTVSLHGLHRDIFSFLHVCCPAGLLLNFFITKTITLKIKHSLQTSRTRRFNMP